MEKISAGRRISLVGLQILLLAGVVFGLFRLSQSYFLAFHTIAELTAIIIAVSIFIFTWNVRKQIDNHFFVWLGISFFFVAIFDLFYTLTYEGMGVLLSGSANLSTQFWVAARYLQSASFLAAFLLVKRKCNPYFMFAGFTLVSGVLIYLIFSGAFPACFMDEVGLMPFKILSEYIAAAMLGLGILLLIHCRRFFNRKVFWQMMAGLILSVLAGISLTLYTSDTDIYAVAGHMFMLFSYVLIYMAVIQVGLREPMAILFHQVQQNERLLKESLRQSEQIAVTDFLTGLYNRRFFVEEMHRELKRIERHKKPMSLLLIDLDEFKLINDQYGHGSGDGVLVQFAQWLKAMVREVDVVARFGGDEFVIILPETEAPAAAEIRRRLQSYLAGVQFPFNEGTITLKASIGMACYNDENNTFDRLLIEADHDLYRQKEKQQKQPKKPEL